MIQEKFRELQEGVGTVKKYFPFLDAPADSKLKRKVELFHKETDEFKLLIKKQRKFLQAVYDYSEDLLDDIEELNHFTDIKQYWEELVKIEGHLKTIEKKEVEFMYRFNKTILNGDMNELLKDGNKIASKVFQEKQASFKREFKIWFSTFLKITEKIDERLIEISHDLEKYYYLDKELEHNRLEVAKAQGPLLNEPKDMDFFVDDTFMEKLELKYEAYFNQEKILRKVLKKKLQSKLPELKRIYTEKFATVEEAHKEIQALDFFDYTEGELKKNQSLTFREGMIVKFSHFTFKYDDGFHVLNGKIRQVDDQYVWKHYAFKIQKNSIKNLNGKLKYKRIKKVKNYL